MFYKVITSIKIYVAYKWQKARPAISHEAYFFLSHLEDQRQGLLAFIHLLKGANREQTLPTFLHCHHEHVVSSSYACRLIVTRRLSWVQPSHQQSRQEGGEDDTQNTNNDSNVVILLVKTIIDIEHIIVILWKIVIITKIDSYQWFILCQALFCEVCTLIILIFTDEAERG